ncbi:hypothetical protein CO173_03090 [Candidatus Uhrbacteria bacterium CG_4_9_14_3_um_filter_41_35]|uniref:Glycerophosphoryl diester phosphodiesterase membrane domain-containing protein n=1 Tax=Candidatus Uhrbacteria bacterium CG_4_9_14_3_um_filter_41_35 TaxID=1975034 RepID=A0A2M7XEL9_9BACT|nr:MAG: hypothetical protein COV92_00685 [Candidatus Uhrbacteria bacterium CG11_big_fil_rev_8_21_14_0_20_41_9]PJA46319.1 MAG: hypothetical protein CO173_03090 [Candidatus Uhrbacteria bacterium CG_4_9_14_3_um_filter_41_35]
MKLGIKKSTDHYEDIILRSFKTAWRHKELWLFATIASFANTGVIFSNVTLALSQLQPASSFHSEILQTNLENIPVVATWVYKIFSLNINQFSLIVILVVLILVGLGIVVIASQQFLITGLHHSIKNKKNLGLPELSKEVKHLHVIRLFAINAIVYLALTIIITGAAIPLSALLVEDSDFYNYLVYSAFYLVLFPISFVLNVLGIFSLINVIRRNQGLVDSVKHSFKLLKQNWLVMFELSLLVFAINIGVVFIGLLGVATLASILSFLAFLSLATGTTLILNIIAIIGAILFTTFSIFFFGMLVTFNYTIWMQLSEKIEGSGIIPIIENLGGVFINHRKK